MIYLPPSFPPSLPLRLSLSLTLSSNNKKLGTTWDYTTTAQQQNHIPPDTVKKAMDRLFLYTINASLKTTIKSSRWQLQETGLKEPHKKHHNYK